jgi:MOSC domain-containing protein YiiM
MMEATEHRVLALWVRSGPGAPLEPRAELVLESGRGIVGDHSFGRLRHVTIVFADDWAEATAELGRDVDPVARRANVLVSGGNGARYLKRSVELGEARLEIRGPTAPCPVMDRAAAGLLDALRPRTRSGVWGRVATGGIVRPGDHLRFAEDRA